MATVFTHAALPLIAAQAIDLPPERRRRFVVTGAVCATLADLDWLGVLVNVPVRESWGHRGMVHSLAAAVLLTLLVQLVFPVLPRRALKGWLWVLACCASHPLLDAFTHGEIGVALVAPFSDQRVLFPFQPIAVVPLGVNEIFGRFGVVVLFNEALTVLVPAAIVVMVLHAQGRRAAMRIAVSVGAWVIICAVVSSLPGFFAPLPRRLEGHLGATDEQRVGWIPTDPAVGLVTRFDELQRLQLFDRELAPPRPLWSSSFFPWWYGGEAGRWQDGTPRLIERTLFGVTPLEPHALEALLSAAKANDTAAQGALWNLSPTEKFDLAMGHLKLPATKDALARTHNGWPRYWYGLCNGVSGAALNEAEPYRVVEAVSPAGDRIRFHPQDIKALLAASWYQATEVTGPRNTCQHVGLDSGGMCSLSAATVVVATANALGLAHRGFIVDVVPALQNQFYAVAQARISVRRAPYPYDGTPSTPELEGKIDRLADVDVTFTLSSTTLGYGPGNRAVAGDATRFEKVGLVPVRITWPATLGLSKAGEIVAGRWTGNLADGPDTIFFGAGGPQLAEPPESAQAIKFNPGLDWPTVQALARASVDDGQNVPTVEISAVGKPPAP